MKRTIPDDFTWSFSKLQTYDRCKLAFCLEYLCGLDEKDKEQNAYADFGTLCHRILEDQAAYNLTPAQMAEGFVSKYPKEVIHPWPPYPANASQNYVEGALNYFASFKGYGENLKVLNTEEAFVLDDLFSSRFKGIIDLVCEDETDHEIIMIDHKSKAENTLKKDYKELKKQLYIYAAYIKKKYGKFPKAIYFNCFRDGVMVGEPFDEKFYHETIEWASDIIEFAWFDTDWLPLEKTNNYFCNWICGVRSYCNGTLILQEEETQEVL